MNDYLGYFVDRFLPIIYIVHRSASPHGFWSFPSPSDVQVAACYFDLVRANLLYHHQSITPRLSEKSSATLTVQWVQSSESHPAPLILSTFLQWPDRPPLDNSKIKNLYLPLPLLLHHLPFPVTCSSPSSILDSSSDGMLSTILSGLDDRMLFAASSSAASIDREL